MILDDPLAKLYQKRSGIEVFHTSLKPKIACDLGLV
jgi:hypothetical protein